MPKKVVPEKKIPVQKIQEPVVVPEPEAAPEEPELPPKEGKSQH